MSILSGPTTSLAPPVTYLGAFQILDSNNQVVYENYVPNVDLALDLSTAQLVKKNETYTIKVLGLPPSGQDGFGGGAAGPGDPRLTYTLTANVMPDEDQNEPDDNVSEAHPIQFTSVGTSQMVTGRLAYVGDRDFYAIQIPATPANATRLHYKITPSSNGGRYPPILDVVGTNPLPNPDRAIELTNLMSSPSVCLDDTVQCPVDPLLVSGSQIDLLRASLCSGGADGDGGALCLLGYRDEENSELAGFTNLENFGGDHPDSADLGPRRDLLPGLPILRWDLLRRSRLHTGARLGGGRTGEQHRVPQHDLDGHSLWDPDRPRHLPDSACRGEVGRDHHRLRLSSEP